LRAAPGLLSCAPRFSWCSEEKTMGRGDRKTRKGKIAIRSYGNARPHAATTKTGKPTATKSPTAKGPLKKIAPVKKAAPKKSA